MGVHCLLCGRDLESLDVVDPRFAGQGLQVHPTALDCRVDFTDRWGIAVDPDTFVPTPSRVDRRAMGILNGEIVMDAFTFIDDVMANFFAEHGLDRLGGASTGRGWTSFSTYQRCPYLWKQRYVKSDREETMIIEPIARAIGTMLHTFLALHYAAMIIDNPYRELTPEMARDYAIKNNGNPSVINESWRVWTSYRLFYMHEVIEPLAIEFDLVDPRTRESCRYDLVAFFPESTPSLEAGTYIVEHKSAGRFDHATLYGWANDGEVLGEFALWKRLGLDRRFGELKGVIVNILGKQPKNPQQHRTIVKPLDWQIEGHLNDLRSWEGLIQLSLSSNHFPRARASCVSRYGMCDLFDHCAGSAPNDDTAGMLTMSGDDA